MTKGFNMLLAARCLAKGSDVVFFDIGANIGMFSFFVARAGSDCHIFEPHPYYYRVLQTRARWLSLERLFRRLGNLYINNIALSNRVGQGTLYHHSTKPGSHSLDREMVVGEGDLTPKPIPVEMITLDQYVSGKSFKKGGNFFLKVDVEGAEADMITGGMGFIENNHPDILIEVRGGGEVCTFKAIADMLLPMGYNLYTDQYTPCKVEGGKLVEWPIFSHADVLFSLKKVDLEPFSCGWPFLSKKAKWLRLFRRIMFLQLADLHAQAFRKPFDVFY